MRRFFRTLILVSLFLGSVAWGQSDKFITGINGYTILGRGLAWGSGVNNNFVFSPLSPNAAVCVYITNNNPSNGHSVNLSLWQTADPQVKAFTGFASKWAQSRSLNSTNVSVGPSATVGFFYNATAAALLTAQISGSSTAAGSPDTADIFAVQVSTNFCGIATPFPMAVTGPLPGNTLNVAAANQTPIPVGGYDQPALGGATLRALKVGQNGYSLYSESGGALLNNLFGGGFPGIGNFTMPATSTGQATQTATVMPDVPLYQNSPGSTKLLAGYVETDRLTAQNENSATAGQQTTFSTSSSTTNPSAGEVLLNDSLAATSSVTVGYRSLVISCSATCEIHVHRSSTLGTCTAGSPVNLNVYGGTRPGYNTAHTVGINCSSAPTVDPQSMFDIFIGANQPYVLDLRGVYNYKQSSGSISGLAVENISALTGTVTLSLLNYETN